ncbi:hypothetical protein BJ165DRAFT_340556 [Panaeolus papilionaceus]|nr:hypothetical protein BJ165DRAFT_340556 [Panaeolus papilionaceus]
MELGLIDLLVRVELYVKYVTHYKEHFLTQKSNHKKFNCEHVNHVRGGITIYNDQSNLCPRRYHLATAPMEPIFPVELIQKIICHVKDDNALSTLISLSYCCTTYAYICRPFIFEHICVGFSDEKIERTVSLLTCLSRNASYLPYVRSLLVDVGHKGRIIHQPRTMQGVIILWESVMFKLPRLDSITLQQHSVDYIRPDSTGVSSLVNKLIAVYISQGKLKSATVDGILQDTEPMEALLKPPPSLLSLTLHSPRFTLYLPPRIAPITSSSNLTTFKVYDPDTFPLYIIDRYPNLTHLELEFQRNYRPHSRICTLAAPPLAKLRYLSYKALNVNKYPTSLTRDFIAMCDPGLGPPFPLLQHVSLAASDETTWAELSILLEKLQGLRTLETDFTTYRPQTGRNPFDVLRIPEHIKTVYTSLRNLSLCISLGSAPAQSQKALNNVTSLLLQISGVNVLETFTLNTVFTRESDTLPSLQIWTTIADCISSEDQFPKMAKFCVSLNIKCDAKFVLSAAAAQHYGTKLKDTFRARIRGGVEVETSMTSMMAPDPLAWLNTLV